MAKKSAERVFIDTNVLVDATDTKRPRHASALALLERRPALVFSAQIAREYLVVATRPVAVNGLGLALDDALSNLAEYRSVVRLLPEEKPLLSQLLRLIRDVPSEGKAIHDALIAATMRVHRIRLLATSNPAHFDRFKDFLRVIEP